MAILTKEVNFEMKKSMWLAVAEGAGEDNMSEN